MSLCAPSFCHYMDSMGETDVHARLPCAKLHLGITNSMDARVWQSCHP